MTLHPMGSFPHLHSPCDPGVAIRAATSSSRRAVPAPPRPAAHTRPPTGLARSAVAVVDR